jgi:hypothetical protein
MRKAVAIVTLLSFGLIGAMPMTAVAQQKDKTPSLDVPVAGTTNNGGTFQGTARITGFAVDGNNVVAVGTITGLVNGTQSIASTFTAVVSPPPASIAAPTAQAPAACQILNLVLGPINLNVLGLVISIPNPVVLNITAVPGAGNLLGNLLCSVANLLNGGGAVQQIADLLNQILGILSGL